MNICIVISMAVSVRIAPQLEFQLHFSARPNPIPDGGSSRDLREGEEENQKYITGFVPGCASKVDSDILPTPAIVFTAGQKVRNLASIFVTTAFGMLCYRSSPTCQEYQNVPDAQMIALCPSHIRCSLVHPSVTTWAYITSPTPQNTCENCSCFGNSPVDCRILLKFGTLVHYGFAKAKVKSIIRQSST